MAIIPTTKVNIEGMNTREKSIKKSLKGLPMKKCAEIKIATETTAIDRKKMIEYHFFCLTRLQNILKVLSVLVVDDGLFS